MQAGVHAPHPVMGLLLMGFLFHFFLIAEQSVLRLTSHIYMVRGLPLTALLVGLLFLPARLRHEDSRCAAIAVLLPLMVLALTAGVPFHSAQQLLLLESAMGVLIVAAGLLLHLPRRWAIAMVLGALAGNADSLLSGPGLHAMGLPVLLQSLWAPLFATACVVLTASVRQNQARRDFLLLRQAVFSGTPGAAGARAETVHLDVQTGVANRLAFDMRFRAAWDHAAARRHSIAILLFSIDHFAEQKQQLGAKFADLLQMQVAKCLKDSLRRADDMVARFDNLHFVVMLPGVGSDGATQIAERLRGMIEEMGVFAGQKRHHVTVTVGAASLRAKRGTPREKLVDGAIQALDQARSTGSNLVCVEGRGCIPAMS